MIKQLLSIAVAVPLFCTLLTGCGNTVRHMEMPTGSIPVGGFSQAWEAPLDLGKKNRVSHLYLSQAGLFVYTDRNMVYCLSPSGGHVMWMRQVGEPGTQMMPPVQSKLGTAIAINSTIWIVGPDGSVVKKIDVGHSVRSPMVAADNFAYCGVDYPNGGRLAKIDLSLDEVWTRWELMTNGGVSATPAFYQGSIYAGSEDGNVYAVDQERNPLWQLPHSAFKTDGPILGGLRVDDFGLYVASMDSKLYCLNRETGKVIWTYFASHPLNKAPQVTADTVYQAVADVGVAAIDKTNGDRIRTAKWMVRGAQRFLAEDSQYVYLRGPNNSIMGVDKATGQQKLHSTRNDLSAFVTNPGGSQIFVATADGLVLAVNPVTTPGIEGQVVRGSDVFERVAAAR